MPSSWKRSRKSFSETDTVESVSESEARIAADFSRVVREVRSVHNTQQAQYALLDALTKCALLDPRKRVHARLSLLSCILDFVGLVQEMYFSFHAFDHEVNAVAVFFLAMPQHTPLNMGCFSEVCHGKGSRSSDNKAPCAASTLCRSLVGCIVEACAMGLDKYS